MSEIRIKRPHGLTLKKARVAAEKVATQLEEEFELAWEWDDDKLTFHRPGVNGHLHVSRHEIEVVAQLGFLLAFLRPRIEEEIHRFCDAQFGKSAKSRV